MSSSTLHLGPGEPFDDESRGHGRYAFEVAADRVVDGHAIGPIGNVGCHFTDMLEACSRFLEELRDVAHGLIGLADGILRGHQVVVRSKPVWPRMKMRLPALTTIHMSLSRVWCGYTSRVLNGRRRSCCIRQIPVV